MQRDYNWIFRGGSGIEPILIPVINTDQDHHPKEAYELNEIFSKAVQRRSRYYLFKPLLDRMVEKAAKELSSLGPRVSSELIKDVKEYLVGFVDLLSRRDDSDDIYRRFKRGLEKRLNSSKKPKIQFVKTAQDTSVLSNRRVYQSKERRSDSYINYWDIFK